MARTIYKYTIWISSKNLRLILIYNHNLQILQFRFSKLLLTPGQCWSMFVHTHCCTACLSYTPARWCFWRWRCGHGFSGGFCRFGGWSGGWFGFSWSRSSWLSSTRTYRSCRFSRWSFSCRWLTHSIFDHSGKWGWTRTSCCTLRWPNGSLQGKINKTKSHSFFFIYTNEQIRAHAYTQTRLSVKQGSFKSSTWGVRSSTAFTLTSSGSRFTSAADLTVVVFCNGR